VGSPVAFDPSQPFETVSSDAPAFDPSQPFEEVGPKAVPAAKPPAGFFQRGWESLKSMRPDVAPDEVTAEDVKPDYGKHDVRRTLQGVNDLITTPEARAAAKGRQQAEDPIRNDPLAGMIVQGIPAAGLGVVAGGLVRPALGPLVQGMTTGAASTPDHPLAGAALGAIPGIPGALGAADTAVGRFALARAAADKSFEATGKALGAGVGATVGHHAGGFVGAGVGAGIGSKVGGMAGRGADTLVDALADRYLARTAQFPRPNAYQPPPFSAAAESPRGPTIDADLVHAPTAPGAQRLLGPAPIELGPIPARAPLAPLAPEPLPPPSSVPPGALGTPHVDEFGAPLTEAGPKGHLTVGGKTVGKPRLSIQDEQGRDLLPAEPESPSLRADVARDAKRFLDEPYSAEPSYQGYVSPEEGAAARPRVLYPNDKGAELGPTGKVTAEPWRGAGEGPAPTPGGLEDQLGASVRMLDELKTARAAGKVSAAMIQGAVKAGISPGAIAKVVGKDSFDAAMAVH
jgi:hypothetical protein